MNQIFSSAQSSPSDSGSRDRFQLRLWSSLLTMLAVAVYFRLSWSSFSDFFRAMDFCDIPFCDFVEFYYEMGKEIFLSKSPFLGFHYSPFFALVLGIFGLFSLKTATIMWVVLLLGCTAGLFVVSYRIASPRPSTAVIIGFLAAFLLSYPVLHNFKWGQVSVLLVLLIVLALFAYAKGRWLLAAFFLAAATSLKFYPALFLLPFIFQRDWRFVSSFLLWCTVLFVVIPILALGQESTFSFLGQISNLAFSKQRAARGSNSQFFVNVVTRWTAVIGFHGKTYETILRTIGLLVLEANLALSFLLIRLKTTRAMQWSFILLFLSLPFLVATSWPHYMVFLPFCQLFLFSVVLDENHKPHRLMKTVLMLSVVFSSVFMIQVAGGWSAYNSAGFLFLADVILLGLCYVLLIPRIRTEWRGLAPHRI